MDKLPRVAVDVKSQRCLSRCSTAAPSENLELQAVDATDASLSDGETQSVCHTAARNAKSQKSADDSPFRTITPVAQLRRRCARYDGRPKFHDAKECVLLSASAPEQHSDY